MPPWRTSPSGRNTLALLGLTLALATGQIVLGRSVILIKGPPETGHRQVTLFAVVASQRRSTVDPKLAQIAAQLRKLKPDHGFRLRGVVSERLGVAESLRCDLGDGLVGVARLLQAENADGKLKIAFSLERGDRTEFQTVVTTPPNQLFFCERPLAEGERLLVGVGAR